MPRRRKTKPKAGFKPWLALMLAAVVAVQAAYFGGALQAGSAPQAAPPEAAPRPAQAPPPSRPPVVPAPRAEPRPTPAPAEPAAAPPAQPEPAARPGQSPPPIAPPAPSPQATVPPAPSPQAAVPPSADPAPDALDRPGAAPAPQPRAAESPTPAPPGGPYAGTVVRRVAPAGEERLLALTFDDGPWPDTPAVLAVLREYGVRATFFWVGLHLQKRPDIARQVVAEGHAVGNHTWSHRNHPMTPEEAGAEIGRTAALIRETTGLQTSLFRPPGGRLHNGLADYALRHGYTVVQWSVLSEDTKAQDAETIAANILADARPGGIVLLHDGGGDRAPTVAALRIALPALLAEGYRLVTVPELLESGR